MASYLHRLSATLFYLLGISFFVAYLLSSNGVGTMYGTWWLKSMDLPLILAGVLYGGSSLYLSVKPGKTGSKGLAIIIGLPLTAIFVFLVAMNFWELIV